jgi:hypothetical protein
MNAGENNGIECDILSMLGMDEGDTIGDPMP